MKIPKIFGDVSPEFIEKLEKDSERWEQSMRDFQERECLEENESDEKYINIVKGPKLKEFEYITFR